MNRPQPHQLAPVPAEYRRFVAPHGKSPWHPSQKALKRVLNPLPAPTVHECGQPVEIAHHDQVYGREYSEWPWMYRCKACDASVGMHPFTGIPLGTLANKALREQRKAAKQPFEQLWMTGRMSRTDAYAALAKHLGVEVEECHFGWFDASRCAIAKAWAEGLLKRGKR